MVTRKKRFSAPVTAAVITPASFEAKYHLPQVVQVETPSVVSFWLRTAISMWHVSVLALFAPLDRR